jgi:phosphoribosyl 1,2-cyclic phosphodiesterase
VQIMITARHNSMGERSAAAMVVRFWGVRGSLPAPARENMRYGGNTSCVEVRSGSQLLILDGGSGIRLLGEELLSTWDSERIDATLLFSHAHWDHIQGLPFFAPGYSAKNHFQIFSAPDFGWRLQRALENQMSPPHFPVDLREMRGLSGVEELSTESVTLGNFHIRPAQLNHPGGCAGFRIETSNASLGYLPDHEPYSGQPNEVESPAAAHRKLVEFVRDLDLLILDTQYTVDEYAQRVGWGHGCLSNSVRLAIEANVARLILFHHDPSHDDKQIDQMLETARMLAAGSSLIVDAAAETTALTIGLTSSRASGIHGPASFPIDIALAPPPLAFETAHEADKSVILPGETAQTALGLL